MTVAYERLTPVCACGAHLPPVMGPPNPSACVVECVACHALVTAVFWRRQDVGLVVTPGAWRV